jgi:hypothetical protein
MKDDPKKNALIFYCYNLIDFMEWGGQFFLYEVINKVTLRSYGYFFHFLHLIFGEICFLQLCPKLPNIVQKSQGILGAKCVKLHNTLNLLLLLCLCNFCLISFFASKFFYALNWHTYVPKFQWSLTLKLFASLKLKLPKTTSSN